MVIDHIESRVSPSAAELRALSKIITVRSSRWVAGWKLLLVGVMIAVASVLGDKRAADIDWVGWVLLSTVVGMLLAMFLSKLLTGKPCLIISRTGVERETGFANRSTYFEWSEVDGIFVVAGTIDQTGLGPSSLVSFNVTGNHPRKRKKLLSDTYDVSLGGDYAMSSQDIVKLLNERLSLWRTSQPPEGNRR